MVVDFFAYYTFVLMIMLTVVAAAILVSSVDDLFVDLCFWGRKAWQGLIRRQPPLTIAQLAATPEKPIAVMVPAWREADVIARMIESTAKTFDYKNFHIFVGSYPNDPDTGREVLRMAEFFPNVHSTLLPHDGGTSKADCLNWIVHSIRRFEENNGIRFEVFVMHDAEDVVHPLELKLVNHLLPAAGMVQLPVFSLNCDWHEFTAGHYIDEFAEHHTKDMPVREMLTGIVPSAGVASAFSREALRHLAAANHDVLFNTKSLTEDYDISFRLRELGIRGRFVRLGEVCELHRRSPVTGRWRSVAAKDYVATREFFPSSAKAAIRQKSRWIMGIGLQGWQSFGWRGSLGMKYMLWRDRKALITAILGMAAYFIVANILAVLAVHHFAEDAYRYPPLVEEGTWLWSVLEANLGFLVWRLGHRALFVGRVHGWEQALLSAPRMVWGNVINFFACERAIRLYTRHLVTGKPLTWDKTDHAFPSVDQLRRRPDALAAAEMGDN